MHAGMMHSIFSTNEYLHDSTMLVRFQSVWEPSLLDETHYIPQCKFTLVLQFEGLSLTDQSCQWMYSYPMPGSIIITGVWLLLLCRYFSCSIFILLLLAFSSTLKPRALQDLCWRHWAGAKSGLWTGLMDWTVDLEFGNDHFLPRSSGNVNTSKCSQVSVIMV